MKHETKNTVEILKWCNTCGRYTRHAVSGKKPTHCLEHSSKTVGAGFSLRQLKEQKKREQEAQNPKLFL